MEPLQSNLDPQVPLPEDDPHRQEAAPSSPERPPRGEGLWETLRSLLVVLVGVLCFRTFIAEATVIPTGSMEKTIMIGDHLFLDKLLYGPQVPYTSWRVPAVRTVRRQEIVAFHYPLNPSVMFVKRIIGIGGDVVRVSNKKVFVNGEPLKEPYVQHLPGILPFRDNFPPTVSQIETLPASL